MVWRLVYLCCVLFLWVDGVIGVYYWHEKCVGVATSTSMWVKYFFEELIAIWKSLLFVWWDLSTIFDHLHGNIPDAADASCQWGAIVIPPATLHITWCDVFIDRLATMLVQQIWARLTIRRRLDPSYLLQVSAEYKTRLFDFLWCLWSDFYDYWKLR